MKFLNLWIVFLVSLGLIIPNMSLAQKSQNDSGSPEIHYCKKSKGIWGVWKVKRVFEEPAGELKETEKKHPHQYIRFRRDGLYFTHKPWRAYRNLQQANKKLSDANKKDSDDVWQYILGKQGVIYFYKNQVFSHSMYCGKVGKGGAGYEKGNIVLTPTDAENKQVYIIYQPVRGRR